MRLRRHGLVLAVALVVTSVAAASAALFAGRAGQPRTLRPVWTAVAWPFPIDEWGIGKAYRCSADACGQEINVYLRSKIGFCNCTTGVSDDAELERLSDFRLAGGKATALNGGRPVTVGWMKGRSRAYALPGLLSSSSMISVAFNNDCDALVATAVTAEAGPATQAQLITFLNSETVERWAKAELGL